MVYESEKGPDEVADEGTAEATTGEPENAKEPVVANPVHKDNPESADEDEDKLEGVRETDKVGKPVGEGEPASVDKSGG